MKKKFGSQDKTCVFLQFSECKNYIAESLRAAWCGLPAGLIGLPAPSFQ